MTTQQNEPIEIWRKDFESAMSHQLIGKSPGGTYEWGSAGHKNGMAFC